MALLRVQIDEDVKKQAEAVFSEIGMDLPTAIRIFLERSVQVGGWPFDPEISPTKLAAILAIKQMRAISEANGNSEMTLDEINEEIKAARMEREAEAESKP